MTPGSVIGRSISHQHLGMDATAQRPDQNAITATQCGDRIAPTRCSHANHVARALGVARLGALLVERIRQVRRSSLNRGDGRSGYSRLTEV
jgi:hypothetical protein